MVKAKKEKVPLKKEIKSKKPAASKVTKEKKPAKVQKLTAPKIKKEAAAKKPRLALKKEKVAVKVILPEEPKLRAHIIAPEKPPAAASAPQPVRETPQPIVKEKAEKQVDAVKPPIKIAPKVAPVVESVPEPAAELSVEAKELQVELPISVKDLAIKLQEKPSTLIKQLMGMGIMVGITQGLNEEVATKLCAKYNLRIKKALDKEEQALSVHKDEDDPLELKVRPPIVTIMGHVDHGKTSLLDAIRKTKVVESEHGGITQHIGAYRVSLPAGEITFLDTPGHEAFTAMRARGASLTDIVVLVVAADDGIMPQTEEAIDHARAAGVSIIIALNKIDKPQADPDRVKKQLSKIGLAAEDWGGKTITVPVSAKTGQGIEDLLEMILLEAQMLELKANPMRPAKGVVVEAKMSKGRGPVSTLLVQNGTLRLNEYIIVGNLYGKIRAMFDDHGRSITSAGPAAPVEVMGITGVPLAGEQFFVVSDEKQARQLAEGRLERQRAQSQKEAKKVTLEDLHAQISEGKLKELKLVLKADVQGSLEAIKDTLAKLNISEIKIDAIHCGVGNINTSDVILAVASNALVLGFNIEIDSLAKDLIAKEGVEVKTYNIIYELANEIKAAVEGMLEPKLKKIFAAKVEIRKVFKLSRSGTVAGCFVTKGRISRNSNVTLLRNGAPIFEGKLSSLKRFKDDVRDVAEGFECGLTIAGFDQIIEGDIVEAYDIEKIARKL